MKLTSVAILCLSLLLVHTHFSLAKRGGFGKSGFGKNKGGSSSTSNRGNTNTNTGRKPNQGTNSQAGNYPRQPQGGYPNQGGIPNQGAYPAPGGHPAGGYPQQPGRAGYPNQGGYPQGGYNPQQPGRGGYPNQYPAGGYAAGGYPGGYGYGGYGGGGYGGGMMNRNPNNQILSPHYGGSYGYGGYGGGGGSPFSQSVQGLGLRPSMQSRGFGRTAIMAAGAGAVMGMALGYGLGRFPRPPFQFHNPQEEQYYNHYMYKKYGTKSTDDNDYSRDYKFIQPPVTYDKYMDSCMKRTDLLPAENPQGKKEPAATTTTTITTTTTTTTITTTTVSMPTSDIGTSNNATETNNTTGEKSLIPAPLTPSPSSQPEVNPLPPASEDTSNDDNDDDTVSMVEIGYPALIEQLKARRCVELYMVYSERYMEKQTQDERSAGPRGGVPRLGMSFQGLVTVVTGTALMLLNSNILLLR